MSQGHDGGHADDATWIGDLLDEDGAARAARPGAEVDRGVPARVERLPVVPEPGRAYAAALARSGRLMMGPISGTLDRERARVPGVVLEVDDVHLDQARLDAYRALIGDRAGDVAGRGESTPPGFIHVSLFGLQLALMTRPDFPLPMIGLVHVANRIEQIRPVACHETLTARTWARALALRPIGGGEHLGTQVELVTEVRVGGGVGGGVVWQGVSTYLAKGVALPGLPIALREPREPFTPPVPTGGWEATRAQSKAYARVSGDRNPIHTSALAAKTFGFPRTIAHGMDTAARALAALGPARGGAFTWRADFAAPVLVPGRVALRVEPVADLETSPDSQRSGWTMEVWTPGRGPLNLRATLAHTDLSAMRDDVG